MKTVRQIADEIGVSKQAVQKRISREPLYTLVVEYIYTEGNTKYIAPEGEKLVKSAFSAITSTTVRTNSVHSTRVDVADPVYTMIGILKEELREKNKQLDTKDTQLTEKDKQIGELTAALENTTASLRAAQALHAGTMHKQMEAGVSELQPIGREEIEKKPGLISRLFGNK